VGWRACRSGRGADGDDLVGNLHNKVRQRCRFWVDLAKEKRSGVSAGSGAVQISRGERKGCCGSRATSPFSSVSGGNDLAQQRAGKRGRWHIVLGEVERDGWSANGI
jgi:hypothetical protein